MNCCDKCSDKRKATHRVDWTPIAINLTDSMLLCDKCYEDFMVLFGNFKEADE